MRLKNTILLEDLSERECLSHESERKAKPGKGYFENVSTQVDIENAGGPIMRKRPDTLGLDSEEFAALIFAKAIK